ncbi:hypothetical protein ACWT_4430 [Actinoplanes sp. SE50]|uniref:tetratricopeptide repeat protein n=1 Tax=unclassified Actinoplanes TaxID=2626549 RepID=UPI00023ECCF1|nr:MULTISPECIES: tetratricopeptide repeat protein [unclassified Actinoplanes]AEV85452.1 tetratricopeptide TPR_2 repeat protein [Actinoplanes sp. SE50/110]ATO83845.1 hypothetical protein ACWT_4430 [Actinoplanes sp. SE50]SLM01255.1 hypothetical protein ACSP50_4491 [Actinoplanes sp. SE50/110]
MPTDWYRTTEWHESAQAEFERRLARARPSSRGQYLRIKAVSLAEAGIVDGARDLYRRVVKVDPDGSSAASATELLGDLERAQGNAAVAEQHYRTLLDRWPTLNGTSRLAELSLAELLTEHGDAHHLAEADRLLIACADRGLAFDDAIFRWNVARARLADRLGDDQSRAAAATTALALVGKGPQLPRHPDVGLVRTDEATLRWLKRLTNRPGG